MRSDLVLIVDDSLTVRMDLAEAFETAGFEVLLARDLEEARRELSSHTVAVVVLDVLLPDGSGVDFLGELRETSSLPILMLSSESEVKSRIRGLRAGADEYVGKPYDRDYVVARAGELVRLGRSRARESCIVLIDDSPTVLFEVGELLTQAGYRVESAGSGEDGLRLVALHRPSLLIVDSLLPGIDGATVIKKVRLDAALRGTPCLLLTESADAEVESRMLDAGADAFLRKSEVQALLLARVAAVLRTGPAPLHGVSSPLGGARILAVDDSPTFLQALVEALGGEGFDVVLASSGEEALEMLAVQSVDCILMDIVMPGMGGREACRRIKAVQGIGDIPLILLSSMSDRESMVEGLGAGADDYVCKSSDFEVLRARVRAQLRRKQFQEEKRRIQSELRDREFEAAEARAALALAQTKTDLLGELEAKHRELEKAYGELKSTQVQLVHSAKMASLGQLVAGIAHEINNPLAYALSNLSSISGWISQLRPAVVGHLDDRELSKWNKIESRVGSAQEGLDRVKELVLKLRTFSRLDEGEFKNIDIVDSIESVVAFLEHRLGQDIVIRRRYGELTELDCFPGSLNQVLMNLVANAIEAIEGPGEITITTEHDEDRFRIRVRDTGIGLPAGAEDKLFEPFFTTKPVGVGTGLGLSISFGIMQSHRGSISARNLSEGGSEFVLEIPRDLASRLKVSGALPSKPT